MGDFSRDPKERLADSIAKHYTGVRMQQGVPILDADWNELEDLRKYELKELFKRFIGDGVPNNNDGFRIAAFPAGGINTVVLQSVSPASDISSMKIDFATSTAASALGFLPNNSNAINYAGAPARLTGNGSEPFLLADGTTLTVMINESAGETVTFVSADFVDITQATALEVAAAINATLTQVTASVGIGDDFIIIGGDGTIEMAGRLLVSGTEVLNEFDLAYTSQPLYKNAQLAALWGGDPIEELEEPTSSDRSDLVYIDVWEREVSSEEDDAIVLPTVGMETTVRMKREWAVRVASGVKDLSGIVRLPGHLYTQLAVLDRLVSNQASIPEANITDLRKRQLTLADLVISPILVKGPFGLDKVNPGLFSNMLKTASRVYHGLLESDYFLADNFSDITAIESVKVLRAFQDIRNFAESGATETMFRRLDNNMALEFLRRLYELQSDFVDAMRDLANTTPQRAGTVLFMDELDTWLEGDGAGIPGLRNSVLPSESPNLGNAYDAQIFINNEIGRRAGILPQGLLELSFVSAPSGTIGAGTTSEFVYSIRSILNVDENIELALTDTLGIFQFSFKNLDEDPNYPGEASHALLMLAKDETRNIAFDLTVPSGTPIGVQSRIVMTARSQLNPEDIDFANVEINVTVGLPVTAPALNLKLTLQFPEINPATDTVPIGKSSEGNYVPFQLNITYLVDQAVSEEFVFTVNFIGNASAFEVLGATTLNPFMLQGSIQADETVVPVPFTIPVGAVDTTADGQESLMVIRLAKTDPTLPKPFFRELFIRIITNITS